MLLIIVFIILFWLVSCFRNRFCFSVSMKDNLLLKIFFVIERLFVCLKDLFALERIFHFSTTVQRRFDLLFIFFCISFVISKTGLFKTNQFCLYFCLPSYARFLHWKQNTPSKTYFFVDKILIYFVFKRKKRKNYIC